MKRYQVNKLKQVSSIGGSAVFRNLNGTTKAITPNSLQRFFDYDTLANDFADNPNGLANAFLATVWAYRCVSIRSRALASIPWVMYDANTDKPVNKKHPWQQAFDVFRGQLFRITESNFLIYGNAYWLPTMHSLAQIEIQTLNPITMFTLRDSYGITGFRQQVLGNTHEWETEEIIYFYEYDPLDDLFGRSPTSWILDAVGVDASMQRFAKTFFDNDATPAGILTTEHRLLNTDAERYKEIFLKEMQGAQNAHKVALLGHGVKYQVITAALKDLALSELDEKTKRRIAAAYGVPVTVALMDDGQNFSTIGEQRRSFYTETVLPQTDMYTDTVTQWLARQGFPFYVLPDVTRIEALQEDRIALTQRSAHSFVNGVRSLNESRALEGLPPLPTDLFIIPGSGPITRSDLEKGLLPAHQTDQTILEAPEQLRTPKPAVRPIAPRAIDTSTTVEGSEEIRTGLSAVDKSVILSELTAWQRKIKSKGKSASFTTNHLPVILANIIREDIANDDIEVKTIFDSIKAMFTEDSLPDTEEFLRYWQALPDVQEYLLESINQVLADAKQFILTTLKEPAWQDNLNSLLNQFFVEHLSFITAKEGIWSDIFNAGAGHGVVLLEDKQASAKVPPVKANFDVIFDFVENQAVQTGATILSILSGDIANTTTSAIITTFADWLAKGRDADSFIDTLDKTPELISKDLAWVFSPQRALMLSQSLSSDAYHQGVQTIWTNAGITKMKFRTQNDPRVCKVCRRLNNTIGTINIGFIDPATGKLVQIPVHLNCRCFAAPEF